MIVECCGLRLGIINIKIYEQLVPRGDGSGVRTGVMLDPWMDGLFIHSKIAGNLPRPLPDVVTRAPMGGKIIASPRGAYGDDNDASVTL